jgi:translation initiation factor 3 subunit B
LAIKNYDNYPMDKTHYLAVNRFTDIEKYSQIEEEYKEPEEEKFVEKVMDFFIQYYIIQH